MRSTVELGGLTGVLGRLLKSDMLTIELYESVLLFHDGVAGECLATQGLRAAIYAFYAGNLEI